MKKYTIEEELGCKDGEVRVAAYLVVTRIDGKFHWSERFSTRSEAERWIKYSA